MRLLHLSVTALPGSLHCIARSRLLHRSRHGTRREFPSRTYKTITFSDVLQYTLTIPNEVLLADLARGLEWIVDPDAREPRSYSWISEILHHFKAQVLLVSSESRLSFRITPQGQSGVHSRDAPDFTFDLLEDLFSDFQLGYWEVKLLTGFKTFSRVFIRHYPQLFRYAKGMLLSNPEVDRIRTLLSCGNEFALLEWGRPRSVPFERSSPPPTTPDLPNWVPLHEKDFYAGLDDLIATLKGEGNFANLQDQDPASLSEEMHRELEHCREVLRDIEDLSPVVIFFGETILDLTGPCLTPAFSHALELLFTPYEVPPEGEQSFLPVPSWEKRKGSIFDRTVPDFQPTEKSLVCIMLSQAAVVELSS